MKKHFRTPKWVVKTAAIVVFTVFPPLVGGISTSFSKPRVPTLQEQNVGNKVVVDKNKLARCWGIPKGLLQDELVYVNINDLGKNLKLRTGILERAKETETAHCFELFKHALYYRHVMQRESNKVYSINTKELNLAYWGLVRFEGIEKHGLKAVSAYGMGTNCIHDSKTEAPDKKI